MNPRTKAAPRPWWAAESATAHWRAQLTQDDTSETNCNRNGKPLCADSWSYLERKRTATGSLGSHLVGYPHTTGWGHTATPPADGGALTWEHVTFQEQKSAV